MSNRLLAQLRITPVSLAMLVIATVLLAAPSVQAACGNGVIEGDESCDDGSQNGSTNSCCTSSCKFANKAPDVIVGDLVGTLRYGPVGGITAYSIGTTSCNLGSCWLNWISGTADHPVIGQNMFRLKGGRFEQIGQSWLKHGFTALAENVCASCMAPPDGTHLGVNCSDPYSSNLNGQQSRLGPKVDVNPSTGVFLYPDSRISGTGDAIFKRLQVHNTDLDPTLNAGALYFVEGQYVTRDDAAAQNNSNNASYRTVTVGSAPNYSLTLTGSTQRQKAGLSAWKVTDSTVTETTAAAASDGRFILAAKATSLGGGVYHYEYAVQNLTSQRAGQSFTVQIPTGTTVTNVGFHDVDYHSGEPFDGTDWTPTVDSNSVSWATTTYAVNQNANALRWGTLYNFRFDANVAPVTGTITLGFFRPGTPTSLSISTVVPSPCAAIETCGNGVDDDCDSANDCADVDCCTHASCSGSDSDGDHFAAVCDCNDTNPAVYPGAAQACDGINNNCSAPGWPAVPANEADSDSDGVRLCGGDCDDANPARFPGNPEVCDGIDNDCADGVPATELDADADGVRGCSGDCDDADPARFPGNPEVCDGIDNDCADGVPATELDADADGVRGCSGDCDDADPARFPGNPEVCDGIDNDCSDGVPAVELDADADGARECGGDCDDADPARFPGNPEVCDGIDNDCADGVPAVELDADADGARVCDGDCDDADPLRYPSNPEICDGIDNNCDGNLPPEELDMNGDLLPDCMIDCDSANASVWATPGEVRNLAMTYAAGITEVKWAAPFYPGCTSPRYDTLRSSTPSDFMAAAICIESDDTDTIAIDADLPLDGEVWFYLVRAENDCPLGEGPLGEALTLAPREGRLCP